MLGIESNNAHKLMCLLHGICITFNEDFLPLIMEGDSQLILNIAIKLQNGTNYTKVSPS